ncbi:MAG: (E)-4-hydroxy-3-methylbut-2-enyl-diphosphate synthase [Porphyromonadaceae bacterium]|nr:(E)-4-hydroxy-3-methylbut-2-enyl-diphosphate synthase [Porphyromonadaceae bacterium]
MSDLYTSSYSTPCVYRRRPSVEVFIGIRPLGKDNPIRLQSMANVSTLDTEASVAQAERIIKAGADYIRYTAQGRKEAANLANIRAGVDALGYSTPLIADIHFNPTAADEALEHIEKVRINPGNYVDTKTATPREWTDEVYRQMHEKVEQRFGAFVERAKELGRTIRIGVNHGSLSERMVMLYGDTPEGMVQSCLEYLDVCRAHNFDRIVISMKSSNTLVMTAAVRLLVRRLEEGGYPAYPLHLGVTEAGEGEDGRIKSAVGIGSLLADGIGDTIRVSLSEDPEFEIPVGKALVDYIASRTPLDVPQEVLPSWEEYNRLRNQSRAQSSTVGKLVGGGNLPIVISPNTLSPNTSSELVQADYSLGTDGYLYGKDGSKVNELTYIKADCYGVTDELIQKLNDNPKAIILLDSSGANVVAEWRLGFVLLRRAGLNNPIVLGHHYNTSDLALFRLQASADAGTILLDGWGNGLCLTADGISDEDTVKTQLGILQATRLRMSKTEFISCPGCGRTLYNLQETIARVKAATSHLKGLKIGIMGCIVNGPGEMADADYGYVGAAPGKIDLYKGQTCIRRGVDQAEAVDQLIDLIKEEGDWQEP